MDDFGGDDLDVGCCGGIVCEGVLLLWSATVCSEAVSFVSDVDVVDDIVQRRLHLKHLRSHFFRVRFVGYGFMEFFG